MKNFSAFFRNIFFAAVALFLVSPLAYLILSALGGRWSLMWAGVQRTFPHLLAKTFFLAFGTTILAVLLAVPLAWLVSRSDLPGRRLFRSLGILPLAIPPYLGALSYVILFGPFGWANRFLQNVFGATGTVFNIYSIGGGILVLGLFTFPYCFLLCMGTLERSNPSLEESARLLGKNPLGIFFHVTLPLMKPALLGGALLVFLYSFADFGAVSILRLKTFTTEIYEQLNTYFDYQSASLLAVLLVAVALSVLWAQRRLVGHARYTQLSSASRPAPLFHLGPWRWVALAYPIVLLGLTLAAPLLVFISQIDSWHTFFGTLVEQGHFIVNSFWTAIAAASISIAMSLSIAVLARRRRGRVARGLSNLIMLQYAIPGTVLGLALILLYNRFLPVVYGSVFMIIIGYILKFIPQSQQGIQSAITQIHSHYEEAARSLGAGWWLRTRQVLIPLIRPGLVASWVLVFVSSMKELAATLLLRPAGFDTLPVRIWIHTVEADYAKAASVALFLLTITAIPILLFQNTLWRREGRI